MGRLKSWLLPFCSGRPVEIRWTSRVAQRISSAKAGTPCTEGSKELHPTPRAAEVNCADLAGVSFGRLLGLVVQQLVEGCKTANHLVETGIHGQKQEQLLDLVS
ncbi:MAG: hypothetical protein AW10_03151 [Candidatus Accumulibacter appositus]|uniref:Uncharacterized protein n=1 Tax=Candidatus Accumulibacter appositus TaxID=1454003 RepID=A0A011PMP3_9PROT|nr:MAG: hypothetical protein AW10_03151 [Candidatus Accumulibacter appositus]